MRVSDVFKIIQLSKIRVTYENDKKGVSLNYEIVGSAVRKAVSRKRNESSEGLFDDNWAEEISTYRKTKEQN